jgi:hypothetical protein
MADLIAKVRLLVGDPAGASAALTDQQIQDCLDENRTTVRYEALEPRPSLTSSAIVYDHYYSRWDHWEQGATLIDGHYATLTPVASDYLTGHFQFASSGSGQLPPVLIFGYSYDINAAAADCLEAIAAIWAFRYNGMVAGQKFDRGGVVTALERRIQSFRNRARPQFVRQERDDLAPEPDARRAGLGISAGVPFITGD